MTHPEDRPPPLLEFKEKPPRGLFGAANRPTLIRVGIAAAGSIVLIVAVSVAYNAGHQRSAKDALPVVTADGSPTRVPPDSPGGLQIPHQGKLVYGTVSPTGTLPPGPDKVLPKAEEPMEKPAAEPAATMAPQQPTPTVVAPAAPPPVPSAQPTVRPPALLGRGTETSPATTALLPPTPPPAALSEKRPPIAPIPSAPAAPTKATPPATAPAPLAAAPKAGGAYRVQLGSFKTEALAADGWRRVSERFKGVLAGQPHQFIKVALGETKGTFYRLQVGSFAAVEEAKRVCDYLKERQQDCIIVRPS
ncbi:MAG: SPOR domain-containing protein [Alphaproteobacteria bacterium]|nr:SPOR domain-containing protein [Alphaproteobacteria bacterium]